MLTIRLQRTGRKGHAQFRVVVQDSRTAPTSGKVIAALGSYNPHTKQSNLDKEKIETFLKNGAQPSDRVIKLLIAEKIKLPDWVEKPAKKEKSIRNGEKLRRNQPAEPEAPAEEPAAEAEEAPAEPPAEETPAEEPAAEATPAEEAASEPVESEEQAA